MNQMLGFARFRHKQEVGKTEKTHAHPPKDVTIISSHANKFDLNLEPLNEHDEFHSNPSYAEGHLEAQGNKESSKKRKLNKIEVVSINGMNSNHHVPEPSFKSASSQFQEEPNHGPATKAGLERELKLMLMGCVNCYLYVMVCGDNYKCPRCCKSDGLLEVVPNI